MSKLEDRIETLRAWLSEHAPHVQEDQGHLNADTAEQAYWHYGYLAALQDVRRLTAN